MFTMWLSTQFIWNIEIYSSGETDKDKVIENLSSLGCKVGAYIPGIDFYSLCTKYLLIADDTAWVSVNMLGTTAEVRLLPRMTKEGQDDISGPANVISKYDGVVAVSYTHLMTFHIAVCLSGSCAVSFVIKFFTPAQSYSDFNMGTGKMHINRNKSIALFIGCLLYTSFADDTQDWDKFAYRAERLQNHVQLLRENMLQLRELYQSKQDARQNKIMGILTIVTTFFLPLTLITGWYGMNFAYMPELKWRYGYPVVILVALIIAVVEFIYFKRKKFF